MKNLRSTQAPSQLITLDLLRHLNLTIHWHLISSVKQRHHKAKIQAPLWAALELLNRFWHSAERTPSLLTLANLSSKLLQLTESVALWHAKWEGTVVEVRKDVDILAREGLGQRWLMDTVEGAWCELTLGILDQGLLSETTADSCRWLSWSDHVDLNLFTKSVSLVHLDLDGPVHAWSNTRVNDRGLKPALVGWVSFVESVDDALVDGVASSHETVSEMGVLVKLEVTSSKVEVVLVVSWRELLWHAVGRRLESWLEDNLSRSTSKVESGSSWSIIWSSNLSKKVVGGDPGKDALLRSVHDNNTLLLVRDDWEWVLGLETVADSLQNILALLWAKLAKTSSSLDCDRSAALELLWNRLHGSLHKDIQTLSSALGVRSVCAESSSSLWRHLEDLVLELWSGATVVEAVDVDAGASAAGIDHENILDDWLGRGAGLLALFGAGCWVGSDLSASIWDNWDDWRNCRNGGGWSCGACAERRLWDIRDCGATCVIVRVCIGSIHGESCRTSNIASLELRPRVLALWSEIVKQEYDEEQDSSRLHVS